MVERSLSIDWGSKKDNIDYLQPMINLNKDLLSNGGVVLGDVSEIDEFVTLVCCLKKFYQTNEEPLIVSSLKVVKELLKQFEL